MKQFYKIIILVVLVNSGFVLNAKSSTDTNNLVLPTATITTNVPSVCFGGTSPVITITGKDGNAPYTFVYKIGTGSDVSVISAGTGNIATINVPTTIAGVFIYTLVSVTDSSGTQAQSDSVTVTVNPLPVVDFTFTNNACSGAAVQFTTTSIGNSYTWNFGDGVTSSLKNPAHTFTSLGCGTKTFNVTLTITDSNGCSGTVTKIITINQQPDISFEDVNATSAANQFNNCTSASISNTSYTITVGNISNSTCIAPYSINWGDGATENNVSFPKTHTYSQLGAYNMVVTALGNNGCSSSKTYIIKNVSNPSGGIISPGSTQNLCIPTSDIQFTIATWATNSPGTTYAIDYGDGSAILNLNQNDMVTTPYYNSTTPSSSSNYPVPYSYKTTSCPNPEFTVTLTVTNVCGFTKGTVANISTLSKPKADFTAPLTACNSTNVLFTNTTALGYDNGCMKDTKFSWDFGDPASGAANIINTGWITNAPNVNHIFSGIGTFTVTLSTKNGCGTTTKTQTICIEPPLVPTFTINPLTACTPLTVTTTNTTNLVGSCAPPTYQWNVTYASDFCGISPAVWTYTSGTATSASPSFNFVTPGTYSISLTTTNSCGAVTSAIQTVTVKKPPTATINPIANICQSLPTTTISPTAAVNSCAPATSTLTYAWSFPGGIPATSNLAIPGPISYAIAGNYTVSLTLTNECGSTIATDKTFTINAVPVLTNSPLTQTICSGSTTTLVTLTSSPAGATFSWTATATAGITGFTPSGTNTIPSQTISTTNAGSGTVTYAMKPSLGACPGAITNYVITVNPAPTITQPASSTVCQGGIPTLLSVTIGGATGTPTYQWYSNSANNTTTGTAITGETNAAYTPSSTTAGILYYYCIITLPSGGCSNIKTNTATVTIMPNASITTQPTPTQNLCVGVTIPTPLTITYSGGTGTATYQWYSNTTSATIGGVLITGATSASYTPPVFTSQGNYYYYATVALNGNGCLPATSNAAEVIVFADPTINSQPLVSQTLCQNAPALNLDVIATGGNGTFTYQWYSNPGNSNTGGFLIPGATGSSYIPPTSTVGTKYYYSVVTQNSTSGCSVTSATAAIIVISAPTITNQPTSSTICLGGTPAVLSVTISGATGTPTYQWYSNTTNVNTGGTAISGATNTTYTPSASTVGTTYYYCIITLPSGGCSNITSNTATVTINAGATISTQPTPTQSLCVGVTIPSPLSVAYSGGTGTAGYQWYSNTTSSITGGILILGATNASYTPPVFSTSGNYYYYAVVTLSGNGCGPVPSDVAQINIVADPIVTTQPLSTQTVCQTAPPSNLTVAVTGGIGATYSYQWFSNASNNTASGTPISGATSDTFSPQTATVGTVYYYCAITQTNGSGCNVTSATATVIVNLAPTFTSQPVSSTICAGGSPAVLAVAYANGVGTPTYQWYSNTANANSGGFAISGATNANFSPPNSTVGTVYYYCVITLPPTGGCSSITSNTATVTINAGATISTQPALTQSLCVGVTISTSLIVSYSGGTGAVSYQWYSNTSNSNTGGTLVSGATNPSYKPPVFTSSGNNYYYVTLSFSGNGCGPISSNPAEIIVVSDPIVSSQPAPSQTLCQGAAPANLTVSATGGIGTYLYQWFSNSSNSNTGGILIGGETNDTFTPTTASVGTTYYYSVITQSGVGCNASSNTAAVIVNLAPTFTSQPSSSTICIGQTPTLLSVSYSNGVGIPVYQWYSNSANTSIGSTAISGATNAAYSPPNSIAGTVYYYCIITLPTGGCSSLTSNIAAVAINPNPVISNGSTIICSGNSFTITPDNLSGDIVPGGTTYTWSNPNISPAASITGTSAQTIQQTNISQTLVNTTTSPATVTYTITPLSGVCVGNNFTAIVTVNPAISPNVTSTNSTCFGANNGVIQTNITGGIPFSSGAPYLISWTGTNGFTAAASSLSNLAPGNYNLSITDAGGCPINETYLITEPDDIVITTVLEKDITCFNEANGAIDITISGGTLNYTFAWAKDGLPYATTADLSNLSPGIYVVTVSDANNCGPKTATFTITEPPILAVNLLNKTNILCFGDATGVITVNVVGGTLPYTYTWSGPNSFISSNQNLTAVFAGTYNLVVTDNLGCTKTLSVTLTQPTAIDITATTTPLICYGANDASISITISGGVAPYAIQWSNLGSGTLQDNLSAGDYLVTVTDKNNCVQTKNVNIPEAPIFTINPVVKNISCFGANDGSITLNFVGGIAPVTLTWNDGAVTGTTRNNLGPGSYTVTIVDSKPCTIKRTFIILEPQLLVLSANVTHAFDCDNTNSGAINLLVSGGSAPFTYAWSNGATTEDLVNIPAGNYLVTVKDANGCSKQAQYSINRPPPIVTGVVTKTVFDCETKTVKQTFVAQVSGGVPPYQLVWSSGTVSGLNNEMMNTNQNGAVILYVTDAIGCPSNYSFNVDVPTLGTPSYTASSYAYSTYGTYSVNDPIQFTNTATGDYVSVAWDFGDGSVATDLNPVHSFINPKEYVVTQTVTYPFGCIYVQKITFIVGKGYVLVVPNAFTPNNDTLNDTFRPVTKGLKNVQLAVYDTWGSLIYSETGAILRGWDGKIKGSNAENGNYYCKVSGETFYGTIVNENHPFVLIK